MTSGPDRSGEPRLNGIYILALLVAYLLLLLWVAWRTERTAPASQTPRRRAVTHALSLSVIGASWAYYGTAAAASQGSLGYLPNFLGPILVFTVFFPLYRRIAVAAKRENAGSIADFLSSRYGKSRGIGALVACVALIGALPYIAEQLTSIASAWAVVARQPAGPPPFAIPLIVVALAVSAILLGARTPTLTRHNRGLLRMVAIEGVVKLGALLAVAAMAVVLLLRAGPDALPRYFAEVGPPSGLNLQFITATVSCMAFVLTWPRMFHMGFVEIEDTDDLNTARWMFPLYMGLWALAVIPIGIAGRVLLDDGVAPTTIVLGLPMAFGGPALTAMAFLGGFSTCTAMVLVETVALSAMISNELLLPLFERMQRSGAVAADRSRLIVTTRRLAMVVLLLLAWLYVVILERSGGFAKFEFLPLVAAVQLAPPLVGAVIWRRGHARGAVWGILGGVSVWLLTIVAPRILANIDPTLVASLREVPAAQVLMERGAFLSLVVNVTLYVVISLRTTPRLIDRVQAATFVGQPAVASSAGNAAMYGTVGDLRLLVERFLGKEDATLAFDDFEHGRAKRLRDDDPVSPALARATERMLAGAIGGSSARNVIGLALAGGGRQAHEINHMLDEAAQAVQFSRELLQTSLDSLDQGVCVVDRDIRLVAWNARYIELFGYGAHDVHVGKPLEQLIRGSISRDAPGATDALIEDRIGPIRRRERQNFERDFSNGLTLRVVGGPLSGGEYVTSFTDVTELRGSARALALANESLEQRVASRTAELTAANAELTAAKGLAERATNSQARFVAAASHDLLQPLHAARLFLGAAAEDLPGKQATRDLVVKADVSIEAADRLLRALLNLSRLEVDGVKPEFAPVGLSAVLGDLRRDFEPLAKKQGVSLSVLPTRQWILSDPDLLRSVLQNLIGNAVRYTPAGGRVVVGCRRRGEGVSVEVADNGPGISAEDLPKIFDEFSRLEGATAAGGGAGLGLAIAQRICKALNHPLAVDSMVGVGSVFSVTAPRCQPNGLVQDRPRNQTLARPLRVLCIDDEPAVLEGAVSLMDRWGVVVGSAASADEARQMVGPWDVILADYQLGTAENGLDYLRSMKGSGAVLALITANSTDRVLVEASEDEIEVIRKPLAPASLRAFLARAAASGGAL